MVGGREEQRRRNQSLTLSVSVTVSREGFMVRKVGSFCSFLKCRKLDCVICENEGLSLSVFYQGFRSVSLYCLTSFFVIVDLFTSCN